jgi:hypothetical protein
MFHVKPRPRFDSEDAVAIREQTDGEHLDNTRVSPTSAGTSVPTLYQGVE